MSLQTVTPKTKTVKKIKVTGSKPVKKMIIVQSTKSDLDEFVKGFGRSSLHGSPTFDLYKDMAGEWRWNLIASNGRILADSGEGYVTKWSCKRAARKFLGI